MVFWFWCSAQEQFPTFPTNSFLNLIYERRLCLVHDNYRRSFYGISEMSNENYWLQKSWTSRPRYMLICYRDTPPIMNELLTTSEIFSLCILAIRKLLILEPKLLHGRETITKISNFIPKNIKKCFICNTFEQ